MIHAPSYDSALLFKLYDGSGLVKHKELGWARLALSDLHPDGGLHELRIEGGLGVIVVFVRAFEHHVGDPVESKKELENRQFAPFRLLLETDRYLPGNVLRGSVVYKADQPIAVHSLSVFLDIHFQSLDGTADSCTSKYFTYQTWGATAPNVGISGTVGGGDGTVASKTVSATAQHNHIDPSAPATTLLPTGVHVWPFEFILRDSDVTAFSRVKAPRIGCRFTASLSLDSPTSGTLVTENLVKWIDLCANFENFTPTLYESKSERYGKDFKMVSPDIATVEWAELPVRLVRPTFEKEDGRREEEPQAGQVIVATPRSGSTRSSPPRSPAFERPKLKSGPSSVPNHIGSSVLLNNPPSDRNGSLTTSKPGKLKTGTGSVPKDIGILGKDDKKRFNLDVSAMSSIASPRVPLSETDLLTFFLTKHHVTFHNDAIADEWESRIGVDLIATQIYYPEVSYHSYTESRNFLTLSTQKLKMDDLPNHIIDAILVSPSPRSASSNGSLPSPSTVSAPVPIKKPSKTLSSSSSETNADVLVSTSPSDSSSSEQPKIKSLSKQGKHHSSISTSNEAPWNDNEFVESVDDFDAFRFKDGAQSLVEHGYPSNEIIPTRNSRYSSPSAERRKLPTLAEPKQRPPFDDLVVVPKGRMPGAVEAYVHAEVYVIDKKGVRHVLDRQPISFGLTPTSTLPPSIPEMRAPSEAVGCEFKFGYLSNTKPTKMANEIELITKVLAPALAADNSRAEFSMHTAIDGSREEDDFRKVGLGQALSTKEFESVPALSVRQHPGLATYPLVNSRNVVEHITSTKTNIDLRPGKR